MLVLAYFVNDSVHDFAAAGRASPAYAAREAISRRLDAESFGHAARTRIANTAITLDMAISNASAPCWSIAVRPS
ncbi:hypothetical protein [Brasilonema sennae]|uniref:hypothetical protein n=1 Tax=Brasilonema sennae TaxID=1397703 RepID=UPI00155A1CF9|nr:hypothetical protein [Brasilonema sennae]